MNPTDENPGQAPRPRRERPARAVPPTDRDDAASGGASAFRPNPGGAAGAGRPRSKSSGGGGAARDRDPSGKRSEAPVAGPTLWERILFGRVGSGQLAQFSRQLAAYLNAGVDLVKALAGLEKLFKGTALGPVIGRVRLAIVRGTTLAEAMGAEPRAFGPLYLSMIKVAEARGGLPETLKMLARTYEHRQRMVRQARSALIYPAIVLFLAASVAVLISIWVLPFFAELLADLSRNTSLPLASRILMAFSRFITMGGWLELPLALVAAPFVLIWLYKRKAGKPIIDRMVLAFPVFGTLCRKMDTTRFARTLSVLLDAGLDHGRSIDLTADVMMMDPLRRAVRSTREKVMAGRELSSALDATRRFTPDVIAVISTGEETGNLPESLAHLADDYEEQVDLMVKNLGQLVQPLITIALGLVVLFVILAVMLPIFNLITSLSSPGGL